MHFYQYMWIPHNMWGPCPGEGSKHPYQWIHNGLREHQRWRLCVWDLGFNQPLPLCTAASACPSGRTGLQGTFLERFKYWYPLFSKSSGQGSQNAECEWASAGGGEWWACTGHLGVDSQLSWKGAKGMKDTSGGCLQLASCNLDLNTCTCVTADLTGVLRGFQ